MIELNNISLEDLKKGFITNEDHAFVCIYCGESFEADEIFHIGDRFFNAERAVLLHIDREHPERFNDLLNSRHLSLTDNQKDLFKHFYSGLNDNDIAKKTGVTASTIRHQRFVFRERARAAKLFLAAWEFVEDNKRKQAKLVPIHKGATMTDKRYEITEEENRKILENMFLSLEPLKLKVFSAKEKKKIVILRKLAEQFEPDRDYTEKEVNAILSAIYDDYATLRRYLVEYGYLARTRDCMRYWRKE